MKTFKGWRDRAGSTLIQMLPTVDNALGTAVRLSFSLLSLTLGFWLLGRLFEVLFDNPVFDSTLIHWLALWTYSIAVAGCTSYGLQSVKVLTARDGRFAGLAIWTICLCIIGVALMSAPGYREASAGLMTLLRGPAGSAEQSILILLERYPLTPLVPVNVAAQQLVAGGIDGQLMAPFVWSMPWIIVLFIGSALFGVLMMFAPHFRGAKASQVILATAGAIATMGIRGKGLDAPELRIGFQAAGIAVVSYQLLIAYASLRLSSSAVKALSPLPPKAMTLVLILFFVAPVLADMHRRYQDVNRIKPPVLADLIRNGHSGLSQMSIESDRCEGKRIVGKRPIWTGSKERKATPSG